MPKLRFNAPAVRTFFEDENYKGIRIKLTDEGVCFKPVTRPDGDDVVPILEKQRCGIILFVDPEAQLTDELMNHLENPYGNPFFLLEKAGRGWVSTIPFDGKNVFGDDAKSPHRLLATMRVWPDKNPDQSPLDYEDLPEFVDEIRGAMVLIRKAARKKGVGFDPQKVAAAERTVNTFRKVVRETFSDAPLRQAVSLISGYIGPHNTNFKRTNLPIYPSTHLFEATEKLPDFVHEIRAAKTLVTTYDAERITGRPPREVTAARNKLRIAKALSWEVISDEPLQEAVAQIANFLAGIVPAQKRHFVNEFSTPIGIKAVAKNQKGSKVVSETSVAA